MDKLEEKRLRLEEKIKTLQSRLARLEAQKKETEQAIEKEKQRKKEERRGVIADTVVKVLGEIPEDRIPSFEEMLELFRESFTPQITISTEEDNVAETETDSLSGDAETNGTDEENTYANNREDSDQ